MKRVLQIGTGVFGLLALVSLPLARAQFVVDSGTPDESSNRSIFYDDENVNQFMAQEFTLAADTTVTQIEVYLGGNTAVNNHVFLTTAIGAAATGADVIDDFLVPTPGTSPSAGAWTGLLSGDLNLTANTYFLVFAPEAVGSAGFLPVDAPNNIGSSYGVSGAGANLATPYASSFLPGGILFGVRVSAVPEPSSIVLVALGGALLMRRRR